ncbi:branched-chain-amino-acid transaminase [Tichowtungia aerotolerans]|uniref:Branched-chain-amino-acid aminotransferase n=1 Tax=Tichowtungia aerotolerans TaxID=2697043 RepID=A0A6P1M5I4_9BACT|nr:branched-chain-amino-acid transaminase [Tichowtungia aerotolerans]QHI68263.1 branched-chain-amino-acid transaminase [Tichowtungia aerotolerans]
MKVFLNGQLVDKKDAVVSVFDHGLLYGDGVFEGTRVYNGNIAFLGEHIDRLLDSAKVIALDIGMTKQELIDATVDTCRANGIENGYIRHVVTRGSGTLGLNPYLCEKASVIIIADNIKLYPQEMYDNGMKIITAGTMRNMPEALNPKVKSLNYLNNIMAKIEAINSGVMECLLLNPQGYVAEASGDNVFVVKGNKLITPPTWCGALDGITRSKVMQLGRELGLDVVEQVMTRYEIWTADEAFLTGTAAEVIAVVELDKRSIGTGTPGPVTHKLVDAYRKLVVEDGIRIDF